MASPIQSTSIAAPGFLGLNTQDSSVTLRDGFATVANNCVIDKFGRIGARQGWTAQHTSNTDLSTSYLKTIAELIDTSGTSYIVAAGNNNLFYYDGTDLNTLSYGGGGTAPTITDDHWQTASLNGIIYFYQEGHDPLYFSPAQSTTSYFRISENPSYVGTVQASNCVISAYGRTWSANTTTDKNTVQFSDLLEGYRLTYGTAGTLDVTTVWPAGGDEIVALAAHNGFLYIFGRRQILIYAGAEEPATIQLQDAITGVGCVARDSVVVTGGDVLFLSDSGVRSLQRVIQEKSAPMRDISSNVRDDLVYEITLENPQDIKAVYSDKHAFYLLSLPTRQLVYCFDMRSTLDNGANRVTTWDNLVPRAFCYTRNKDLLFGNAGFIGLYDGYTDNTNTYRMKYYTNYFDFQSPTTMKFLKKVGITLFGGGGYTINLKFGFDYYDILRNRQFSIGSATVAEYNIAEYGIAEYGGSSFNSKTVNVGGSGRVIQLGIETIVDSKPISIQKLDIYVKAGKTL